MDEDYSESFDASSDIDMSSDFDTSSDIDTSDVFDDVTADIPDDIPEDVPEDIPEEMPEDVADDISEEVPDDVPDDIPEDIPDEMPEDVADDISEEVPEDVPADIQEDVPEDIPEEMPEDVADDISEEVPEDVPVDIQEDVPEDIPEEMPEDVADDISEEVPEDVPADIQEDVPEDIPDEMPEDVADDISEEVPDDVPADIQEDVPEDIPEEMPEDVADDTSSEAAEDDSEHNSYLDAQNYETEPETKDSFNSETSGESVSTDNPYKEDWQNFEEEFSEGNKNNDWDSLNEVPFNEENTPDINSDVTGDGEELNSLSDYMNAHNYSESDFDTYSQDPQWRQLMREEYPDYELPEMTQESANAQLAKYMNDHNYGIDDYDEYSQDPIWRDLHSNAFPNNELPPLKATDNLGEWNDIPSDITPQENIDATNPNYDLGEEWQVNCQRCVPTYEMRSRGYDVTAQPCVDDNDHLAYNPFDVWENPDVISTTGDGMSDIQNKMSEWGDGSRAQVVVLWDNGDGGHTFTAEQVDGATRFVDPQNGDTDVDWYFDEAKKDCTQFCRIDNAQPSNYMLNCCDKRGN